MLVKYLPKTFSFAEDWKYVKFFILKSCRVLSVSYPLLKMGNESSCERYYALTATDEDYTGDQDANSPSPYLVSSLEVDVISYCVN